MSICEDSPLYSQIIGEDPQILVSKPPSYNTSDIAPPLCSTPVLRSAVRESNKAFISLTDMLKAKDGDFFISDWLRNRNTIEFLGIWETVHNPDFNSGEFALIKSQGGLNSYKLSIKEWVEKTHAAGLRATAGRYGGTYAHHERMRGLNSST